MTAAPAPLGDPFDALGDPQRREILRLLADADRSVAELAGTLPISRPAVSRHLRVLKQAGMVSEEPVGTRRIYRLQAEGALAVQRYLRAGVGRRRHPISPLRREHRAASSTDD